jgi:hypothetical protein
MGDEVTSDAGHGEPQQKLADAAWRASYIGNATFHQEEDSTADYG